MKRVTLLAVVLLAVGCDSQSLPGGRQQMQGRTAQAGGEPEEFEGTVDLAGKKVRACRQVILDADGNYVKHGRSVAYYENGQKAGEMWYQQDKPTGPEYSWHENGKKKMHGQSTMGLATGRWTEWYDNGQKQSEGDYVNGERNGQWTFWEPSGSVKETVEYRFGQKMSVAENPAAEFNR
jgi:hypothetical protein